MLTRLVMNRSALALKSRYSDGPANDGIEPGGLLTDLHAIPGVWTINGYDALVKWLIAQFDLAEATVTGKQANLLLFPYDWRLSNRYNGRRFKEALAQRLDAWRKLSANSDAKATLICHSMGGLVARWCLDVEGGAPLCRRLITIGTPYQGAPEAIGALANGVHPGLGPLRADLTELVRSCPSVAELMACYPCVDRGDGELVRLRDATNVPQVDRAAVEWGAAFHDELARAAPQFGETEYQTIAIKGHRQPTNQVVKVTAQGVVLDNLEDHGNLVPYRRPAWDGKGLEKLVNARGDGTVPRGSSHPRQWRGEDQPRASDKVQGFAPKHADLQNGPDLHESLYQILTADRLGQNAGGVPIGILAPEMARLGEPVPVEVITDPPDENLMLEVHVDGCPEPAGYLANQGGGRYRGEVRGLPADVHGLTITGTPGSTQVVEVTHLVTVADGNQLGQLRDAADVQGVD
jgi:pimeloyl-ACP methyl ester carboxylesterase